MLERETGFEPATSTLARSHSTTELFPLARCSIVKVPQGDAANQDGRRGSAPFRHPDPSSPNAFARISTHAVSPGPIVTATTSKRLG